MSGCTGGGQEQSSDPDSPSGWDQQRLDAPTGTRILASLPRLPCMSLPLPASPLSARYARRTPASVVWFDAARSTMSPPAPPSPPFGPPLSTYFSRRNAQQPTHTEPRTGVGGGGQARSSSGGYACIDEWPCSGHGRAEVARAASRRISKEARDQAREQQGSKGSREQGVEALREQGVEDGQETKAGMDHVLHAPSLMAPSSLLSSSPLSLSLLYIRPSCYPLYS